MEFNLGRLTHSTSLKDRTDWQAACLQCVKTLPWGYGVNPSILARVTASLDKCGNKHKLNITMPQGSGFFDLECLSRLLLLLAITMALLTFYYIKNNPKLIHFGIMKWATKFYRFALKWPKIIFWWEHSSTVYIHSLLFRIPHSNSLAQLWHCGDGNLHNARVQTRKHFQHKILHWQASVSVFFISHCIVLSNIQPILKFWQTDQYLLQINQ